MTSAGWQIMGLMRVAPADLLADKAGYISEVDTADGR